MAVCFPVESKEDGEGCSGFLLMGANKLGGPEAGCCKLVASTPALSPLFLLALEHQKDPVQRVIFMSALDN